MAEPALTDVFGSSATQTNTTLTILKADLPFTASANNTAESLLAAIAKKAATILNNTNFATNPDQSIAIVPGFDQIVYRNISGTQTPYLQNALTFNFAKTQSSAGVTPDSY